jgi:hypothetical protein
MTPSEIRAGLRRAADQLGIDSPEGRVVCEALEKLDAVPGVTEVQMDRLGYYVTRRELKLIRGKHDTGKYLKPVIAERRAARDADRDMIRAYREDGGKMQVKHLQHALARKLNSCGRGYLERLLREIKNS